MSIEISLDLGIVLGAAITAVGALYVSNQWKKEVVGKRLAALSEELLVSAARCHSGIEYARASLTRSGEGETRPLSEREKESKQRNSHCDVYYSRVERLEEYAEYFSELASNCAVLAAYHGREEVNKISRAFLMARHKIFWAAHSMIEMELKGQSEDNPNFEQQEKVIWNDGEEDSLKKEVDEALRNLEKICAPYLGRKVKNNKENNNVKPSS